MASITCGACKGTHPDVNMVRNCYGKVQAAKANTTPKWAKSHQRSFGANEARRTVTRPAVRLATDPQISYIADLMVELGNYDSTKADYVEAMNKSRQQGGLTFALASETIDSLKGQVHDKRTREAQAPAPSANRNNLPDVPAGRYAVEEDGTLKFFRVDRPTEGRWAGRTFLKIQASDDLYNVRDPQRKFAILLAIAEDPRAASVRYGRELGKCGVCGKVLTDETSRANGIGPVCAAKF